MASDMSMPTSKRHRFSPEQQLDAGLIDLAEFRRLDARSANHKWDDWRTPKQRRIEDTIEDLIKADYGCEAKRGSMSGATSLS